MKKNIVWLSAYPKSGRTWSKIMLESIIFNNGNSIDINNLKITKGTVISRKHFDQHFGIPSSDLTPGETLRYKRSFFYSLENSDPNYILTHEENSILKDGGRLFPEPITQSAIQIVRNPLSIVSSLANHLGISTDTSIQILNSDNSLNVPNGENPFPITTKVYAKTGSWSSHINSWINNPPYAVHLVRYEDLVLETKKTLEKIILFLNLNIESSIIARAIENTNFEKLSTAETKGGFIEKPATSKGFFRKGEIDSWKEELTETQIKKVIDNHGELMHKLGYLK